VVPDGEGSVSLERLPGAHRVRIGDRVHPDSDGLRQCVQERRVPALRLPDAALEAEERSEDRAQGDACEHRGRDGTGRPSQCCEHHCGHAEDRGSYHRPEHRARDDASSDVVNEALVGRIATSLGRRVEQ
jgi:hypothetical protein